MRRLQNIPESGVNCEGLLSPRETCKANESVQQNHPKTVDSVNITERLQPVSTDLTRSISSTAPEGYRYMSKNTNDFPRFEVISNLKTKDETLAALCGFIQDLAVPLEFRVHRLRSDHWGEYIADYVKTCCKTTGIRWELTASYTPQENGISEGNGRTIINVTRCLLEESNLPKSSGEKLRQVRSS